MERSVEEETEIMRDKMKWENGRGAMVDSTRKKEGL